MFGDAKLEIKNQLANITIENLIESSKSIDDI